MSGYLVYLDGSLASDPYDDAPGVISARLSQKVNAAAWLDLELSPSAASGVSPGSTRVEVGFGGETLFLGRAVSVTTETDGTVSVEAVSDLDMLTRVLAPPHSTDGSVGETCPNKLDGYFSWLLGKASERPAGGVPIFGGENQGSSIRQSEMVVSEGEWKSVAELMDDHVLSAGGYLVYEQHATSGTVSLMADISSASEQIVDLGENLLSIGVTRDSSEQRSAVVASGVDGLTLEGAGDDVRAIVANSGMMLSGAAIYDPEAVSEHGWSEEAYDYDSDDAASLARAAVARLRTLLAPSLSVTCRAVDMSLYRDGYAHLGIGQAVRVRSLPHGVDEYLVVQSIDLDMADPSQSTYELGVAYDTLTGQQSAYLRRLNGDINHALDEVGALEGAVSAGNALSKDAVDKALQALDKAQEALDGLGAVEGDVSGNRSEIDLLKKEAEQIAQRAEQAGSRADEAWEAASSASSALDSAVESLSGQIGDVETTLTEQGRLIEGAASDASSALEVSTETRQTVEAISSRAELAVETAEGAMTKASEVEQTASGLSARIESTSQTADAAMDKASSLSVTVEGLSQDVTAAAETAQASMSAASSVEASLEGFKSSVAETYETKDGAEGLVAQERLDRQSAIEQSKESILAEVGQKYVDKETGQSYATKADLELTEESISSTVGRTYLPRADAEQTYASKTDVEQAVDKITSTVSEAVDTAEGAMTKASQVEQTVDGLEVRLTALDAVRNLALATGDPIEYAHDSSDTFFRPIGLPVNSEHGVGLMGDGGTFTLSFDWSATGVTTAFTLTPSLQSTSSSYSQPTWTSGSAVTVPTGSSSGHFSRSFSPTSGQRSYGGKWLMSGPGSGRNDGASLVVTSFMLEAGGEEHAWRPAPEDVADAAKTATNFLRFDSSGLCVGNQTAGSLGYNTLMRSTSVDVRNGTTVLSRFGASTVELGRNSTSAQIKMCGGGVTLSYNSASGLVVSDGAFFDGAVQCSQLATSGTLNVGGNMWLGTGQRTQIRGFYQGSKIISGTSTACTLFTKSQYTTIVGRAHKTGDVVLVCNGDWSAAHAYLNAAVYNGDTGNWYVVQDKAVSGNMRINYLIVAVA